MGEAKRRKNAPRMVTTHAPEVQAMFDVAGRPINIYTIGAGMVAAMMHIVARDALIRDPAHRPWRLAFGFYDRIRTGEIKPWQCFLCQRPYAGLGRLSCFYIIDRVPAVKANQAAILPICHACDGISIEETRRQVVAAFPMSHPLAEGTA